MAVLIAGALAAIGCTPGSDPATSASTIAAVPAPTTAVVTENFSGTVQPGSNDAHSFTVTTDNATISLTLTSAGPPSTIAMGFGLGQMVAGSCQLISGGFGTYAASTTPQLSGTIGSGAYCVMVYDVGNQSAAITYTVVVNHY
jgi:hypothetical protein